MIQIDIEMPKRCTDCPCFDGEYGVCNVKGFDYSCDWGNERLDNCPLTELKGENNSNNYWTYIGNSSVNGLKICECSNCNKRTYGSHKYCPNCGAKMEGEYK